MKTIFTTLADKIGFGLLAFALVACLAGSAEANHRRGPVERIIDAAQNDNHHHRNDVQAVVVLQQRQRHHHHNQQQVVLLPVVAPQAYYAPQQLNSGCAQSYSAPVLRLETGHNCGALLLRSH